MPTFLKMLGVLSALTLHLLPASPAVAADPILALATELADGQHPGIHAMRVERGGVALAEWDTVAPDSPADLRSVTKSITALLVGIAIDRGEIAGVDAPIAGYLPEYAGHFASEAGKARIRVRDLLSMRSGLDCDDWSPDSPGHEDRMYQHRDWIGFWLQQSLRDPPGSRFAYCTGNAIALGRILRNVSGQSLDDYARERLFTPLGIDGARWERWNRGRDIDSGGHLRLSPQALSRIGALVLAKGRWQGREIVSGSWIATMTAEHAVVPGRSQRYGYLWWVDRTTLPELPRTRIWMAWGNGGSFLILLPELDASVVFVGSRYNRPEALQPLHWLRDRILPALRP